VKQAHRPSHQRLWLVAVAVVVAGLVASTWWLLVEKTRGVEIATVLALPVAILSTVATIIAAAVAMRR
jgi:hypothetical protein